MSRVAFVTNPPLRGAGLRGFEPAHLPSLTAAQAQRVVAYTKMMLGSGHAPDEVLPRYDVPVRLLQHGSGHDSMYGSGLSSLWGMMLPVVKKTWTKAAPALKKLGKLAIGAVAAKGAEKIQEKFDPDKDGASKRLKEEGERIIRETIDRGRQYAIDRSKLLASEGIDRAQSIVNDQVDKIQSKVNAGIDKAQARLTGVAEKSATAADGVANLGRRALARLRAQQGNGLSDDQNIVLAYAGSNIRFADSAPARINVRLAQGMSPGKLRAGTYFGSGMYRAAATGSGMYRAAAGSGMYRAAATGSGMYRAAATGSGCGHSKNCHCAA